MIPTSMQSVLANANANNLRSGPKPITGNDQWAETFLPSVEVGYMFYYFTLDLHAFLQLTGSGVLWKKMH